jgi:hypothetical protein
VLERILKSNKDLIFETVKKLMKTDMTISKECGLQLIISLFSVMNVE